MLRKRVRDKCVSMFKILIESSSERCWHYSVLVYTYNWLDSTRGFFELLGKETFWIDEYSPSERSGEKASVSIDKWHASHSIWFGQPYFGWCWSVSSGNGRWYENPSRKRSLQSTARYGKNVDWPLNEIWSHCLKLGYYFLWLTATMTKATF